jgi:hypothetical protein
MRFHSLIIPAALLVTTTLYAAAPPPMSAPPAASAAAHLPNSPVPVFAKADANHNGKISWSEAKALGVPQKTFKQDDFDRNGALNETEWMFVRLDMTDFGTGTAAAPATATPAASAPASATGG